MNATHKTTFLHIDDDKDEILFVARAFRQAPAQVKVEHVTDGREAVRYLEGKGKYEDRRKYPLPNVILLDLKMPDFDGFDFLQWLRSQAGSDLHLIPVIVVAASVDPADVRRAYALGASSYIHKPLDWPLFTERMKLLGIYWSEHAETP